MCMANGDWFYARHAVHQSRLGSMPASALEPPKLTRCHLWLKVWVSGEKSTTRPQATISHPKKTIDDLTQVVEPNSTTAILRPSPMKSQPTLSVQSPPEVSQSLTFPPKPSRPCPLPDRGAETPPPVEPNALPSNQHKAAARAPFNPQPGLAHPSASNHTKHVPSCVRSPLPSPPKGTLRLLTFGLANAEEELIELCWNSKDGGACIYVEDYILKDALHRLGEPHVDLVLDARNFPDPHGRKITSHPGF